MAEPKSLTYAEVAEHNSKKDLYVVIHDKVYNSSSFVDEHPYVFALSLFSLAAQSRALCLVPYQCFRYAVPLIIPDINPRKKLY
jgi:hypothetical protein